MVAAKGKLAVANTNTGKAKSFGKKSAFQSHNPPNNVLPKKPNSMVPSQGCDTSEKAKSRLQAEHEDSRGIRGKFLISQPEQVFGAAKIVSAHM